MDTDLLTDIFAFLPEKYFVTRLLNRDFSIRKTEISFVDYERAHYVHVKLLNYPVKWWKKRLGDVHHQEYGPARESSIDTKYMMNGYKHRKNGPAVIFKEKGREIRAYYPVNSRWVYNYYDCGFSTRTDEKILVALKSMWFENGIPIKCQGDTETELDIIYQRTTTIKLPLMLKYFSILYSHFSSQSSVGDIPLK